MLILLAYNLATTGHATELLYAHEANYTFMSHGFGFALPSLEALFGLTFSAYRGLFYYMPVLLVLLLWKLWSIRSVRDLPRSAPVIAAAINIIVVSAYAMWWGGWAYGPRHLCAAAVLLIAAGLPLIGFGQAMAACVVRRLRHRAVHELGSEEHRMVLVANRGTPTPV